MRCGRCVVGGTDEPMISSKVWSEYWATVVKKLGRLWAMSIINYGLSQKR